MVESAGHDDFVALIRRQADDFARTEVKAVEYVSASVTRVAKFANHGLSHSGHEIPVDEPQQFGGGGMAPDPAELLLMAVGASLSVTLTVHAAISGCAVDGVAVGMRGKLDPERFFEPSAAPGGGFYDLEIDLSLTTNEDEKDIEKLVDRAMMACPMLRSVDALPVLNLTIEKVSR